MERKLIAAAVSSALVLPMAAQAVEFSVSGQVNRAIISVDGGGSTGKADKYDGDVQHVDSNASSSRFTFAGSEELESGVTAGVQLQIDNFFGGDNAGMAPANQEHSSRTIRTRQGHVYLSTAGGKITIGKSSTAADGVAHADLGGPSWLGGATNWCSYASSGPACPSNDGGRKEVLRYDTPAIGPASIAVATGNNDFFDISLKIAGSMGDAGYDFRIGHTAEHEADVAKVERSSTAVRAGDLQKTLADGKETVAEHFKDETFSLQQADGTPIANDGALASIGANTIVYKNQAEKAKTTKDVGDIVTMSGAVSFGQGTSVAAAWSQQDTGAQVEYQYLKLDHSYGEGSVGIYYKTGEYGATDAAAKSTKGVGGSVWGIGIGHSLGGGAHVYAGYRQISEDKTKDIDLLLAGMRVTFN